MASTFYDWHLARSQNRMEQKPLFDNGIQVERYHHKNGLVLTFLAVVTGKQLTVLLDNERARYLRDNVLSLFPTDEVGRLRLAMTAITHHARNLLSHAESDYEMDNIQAILETASKWAKMSDAKDDEIAALKEQVKDLERQLDEAIEGGTGS